MFGYEAMTVKEMVRFIIYEGDLLVKLLAIVLVYLCAMLLQIVYESFVLGGVSRIMMKRDRKKEYFGWDKNNKVYIQEVYQLQGNLIKFSRMAAFFPIFSVTMPIAAFIYKGVWRWPQRVKRAFRLYWQEMLSYI